jgi:hypothetical protein
LKILQKLLKRVGQALDTVTDQAERWRGHRVFLLDGSGFSMPDMSELQKEYGQPSAQKSGCGFPVAHMLLLFHAGTGLIRQVLTAPLRTHDMSRASAMHPELRENDVLVGDRGVSSFAHPALLFQRNLHGLFRAHPNVLIDFTPFRGHVEPGKNKKAKGTRRSRWLGHFGATDQVVEWFKPELRPDWMTAARERSCSQEPVATGTHGGQNRASGQNLRLPIDPPYSSPIRRAAAYLNKALQLTGRLLQCFEVDVY